MAFSSPRALACIHVYVQRASYGRASGGVHTGVRTGAGARIMRTGIHAHNARLPPPPRWYLTNLPSCSTTFQVLTRRRGDYTLLRSVRINYNPCVEPQPHINSLPDLYLCQGRIRAAQRFPLTQVQITLSIEMRLGFGEWLHKSAQSYRTRQKLGEYG